jgi:hypothetical protein
VGLSFNHYCKHLVITVINIKVKTVVIYPYTKNSIPSRGVSEHNWL